MKRLRTPDLDKRLKNLVDAKKWLFNKQLDFRVELPSLIIQMLQVIKLSKFDLVYKSQPGIIIWRSIFA